MATIMPFSSPLYVSSDPLHMASAQQMSTVIEEIH